MARLPLTGLQWAGRLLGCLVYWGSPGYRRKIRANLARAGYPPGLRAQAARAAGDARPGSNDSMRAPLAGQLTVAP